MGEFIVIGLVAFVGILATAAMGIKAVNAVRAESQTLRDNFFGELRAIREMNADHVARLEDANTMLRSRVSMEGPGDAGIAVEPDYSAIQKQQADEEAFERKREKLMNDLAARTCEIQDDENEEAA